MSFNKSNGSKSSSSQSQQQWNYGSDVWGPQQQYLQALYKTGNDLAYSNAGQQAGYNAVNDAWMGNQQGQGLYDTATNQTGYALSNLGAGQGFNQAGNYALGRSEGALRTLDRLQNPGVDPMMNVYSRNIGQQFREQIMPELQGQAAMGGGLGGSRAQIGQALAGARAGQQIQDFGAQLYGQGQDRALQAAGAQGGMLQGIAQGYQNAAGLQNQFAQTGLSAANTYGQLGQAKQQGAMNNLSIGQMAMNVPWFAQQQQAALLGGPAMRNLGGYGVGTGSSKGSGGGGFGFGGQWEFGK